MEWFGISKSRKAIHVEMEKQKFGKQIFAGPSLTMGPREHYDQTGLAWFLSTPSSYQTMVVCDDSFLLEKVLCLNSFLALRGNLKVFLESFVS